MNERNDEKFTPRAPRFQVSDSEQIDVQIMRTEKGSVEAIEASLIDVSQHGVKLRVPVNLRFEEALQLQIEVNKAGIEYHGIASVRHIRTVDDQHWVIGCAVAPPLSDETFSYLATTAGKERRRFRRLNIAAEATVRRQGQTEGIPAVLHNLSSGGFCFSSSDQYENGERVKLTLEDNDGKVRTIEAKVCWQVDSPDGGIAGCQFSSSESYAELCACLTEQPVASPKKRTAEEPTSKLVLAAAVLAMFVPPMMTLMLQANKVSANVGTTVAEVTEVEPPRGDLDQTVEAAVEATVDQGLIALLTDELQEPDPQAAEDIAEEKVVAPEQPEVTENEASFREWIDNTGKFRTIAQLIEVTDEHVILLKQDGKKSTVPWRRLSESDQAFAREWNAAKE